MARIQPFMKLIICNRMKRVIICPAAVVAMNHFSHQPEIFFHAICKVTHSLHKIKIKDICCIQAYSINIKFRYPETDNIKQVILYLCISLVQLYQKIITAPVFITKAVIVLIVPAKIQVTEPATVWGLLPLCLYVFKRKETSPYMVKNTIYNYF